MADQSIRGYLGSLEQQGELLRFSAEVDPHADLTAIGWKTYDKLGKSSLFDNLKGFPGWRVANQIVTDRRKWGIALGVTESQVIGEITARSKGEIPPDAADPATAPVKEPFLCPKSSLSRSVSVKALQLTEMNPCSLLWERS